jgi:hypothetical protein
MVSAKNVFTGGDSSHSRALLNAVTTSWQDQGALTRKIELNCIFNLSRLAAPPESG